MRIRCVVVASLLLSMAGAALAQPSTRLEYQVAVPGGPWTSSLTGVLPGQQVEWRIVVSYTGSASPVALGSIAYVPILSNVDNAGVGAQLDQLGAFRSPAGPASILSEAEGASSASLASYGRVQYVGINSNTYAGIRHSNGSAGAPAGNYIRIAISDFSAWGSAGGPVAQNPDAIGPGFVTGTQNMVVFRQAFIASTDAPATTRIVTLASSANPGFAFARWANQGEGGVNASVTSEIQFVGATIEIVPSPGVGVGLVAGLGVWARRRRA